MSCPNHRRLHHERTIKIIRIALAEYSIVYDLRAGTGIVSSLDYSNTPLTLQVTMSADASNHVVSGFSKHPLKVPGFSPFKGSMILAATYLLGGAVYIVISGQIAAGAAETVEQLQRIETIKGIIFIVFTGILITSSAYILLTKIAQREVDLIQQREALIISESRAMAGLMASSVAHDINNVLTVVQFAVDRLVAIKQETDEFNTMASSIQTSATHLKALAHRMVEIARERNIKEFDKVDLVEIAKESCQIAAINMRNLENSINLQGDSSMRIFGSHIVLQQMLLNLIINAMDAAGKNGKVLVCISGHENGALLEVHDSGPGVNPEIRSQLFQPFFTTKPSGTGLGLLSVKNCAEAHGGRVDVEDSEELGGACFTVRLPVEHFNTAVS